MKSHLNSLYLLCLGLFAAVGSGCDQPTGGGASASVPASPPPLSHETEAPALGLPSEYFPMDVGRTWRYQIELGPAEPLRYSEITWPLGEHGVTYAVRGRFLAAAREEKKAAFRLELRVKRAAPTQGPLKYRDGVELEIVTDELGVFDDAKQVFFAASRGSRYMANLVVTHDPDRAGEPSGAWGGWGQGDGHAMRPIFFGEKPGIQIGLGSEPTDKLLFVGVDRKAPGRVGVELLHFRRTVSPSEKTEKKPAPEPAEGTLNKGFTEDTWYTKGVGLVRLEQRVDGQRAMVWSFAK